LRDDSETSDLPRILLDWYDVHARAMPWRISPADRKAGVAPDPYRIWLSEVMLQQTTVATVRDYFQRFTARWPTVADLAAAQDADVMGEWAGLGYYARARNLLKCARVVVAEHGGRFPETRVALLNLPGIGPYTASAIAAIAFAVWGFNEVGGGDYIDCVSRAGSDQQAIDDCANEFTQRVEDQFSVTVTPTP